MKMMWTAENNTNLYEDMIVALVIAVYKQDKLTPFFFLIFILLKYRLFFFFFFSGQFAIA